MSDPVDARQHRGHPPVPVAPDATPPTAATPTAASVPCRDSRSSSRSPRPGRPSGPSHAIGCSRKSDAVVVSLPFRQTCWWKQDRNIVRRRSQRLPGFRLPAQKLNVSAAHGDSDTSAPVAIVRSPWPVVQLDTGNLMADEPIPAPSARDIPDGGAGVSEHSFTSQRQLPEPDTLTPARRIPRHREYPAARGLQLHAVVHAIAERILERRFPPLGCADYLARPFPPGRPVRHGVVDLAIADRHELEPD